MVDEPIVEVENLHAVYGNRTVLSNVDVAVQRNEIFVILGASGGGKTTLLKHIISLLKPHSGDVKLFGKSILNLERHEMDAVLRRMGVLFQGGALLNSLPVWENIAIPLEQHTDLPTPIIQDLIKQKLSLVGLKDAFYLLPSELSGGMRKRVALARAIILEPEILFFDEPSAGLDPVTARGLDQLILRLKKQLGMTLVVVTHETESIERIADRILFLADGKVIFCGTLKQARKARIPQIQDFFGW